MKNKTNVVVALTYNAPHLKSQQVLTNWASRRAFDVLVVGLPFRQFRKRSPQFAHRPNQDCGTPIQATCAELGYEFREALSLEELPPLLRSSDCGVVLGAGILPEAVVSACPIINCHPGIIPESRGQDAFKWAILDDRDLGVTLHVIDAEVDMGKVLHVERTPIFSGDTLVQLSKRHYELEIFLLSTFDLPRRFRHATSSEALPPKGRMNIVDEGRMMEVSMDYIQRRGVAGPP